MINVQKPKMHKNIKNGQQQNVYCGDNNIFEMLMGNEELDMPMPPIELDPHLLISKVRKHYYEYIVNILSTNYQNSQKLEGKNIRIPSGIWRCARYLEIQAAQACMLVALYRKNIIQTIKNIKSDTESRKLYRLLLNYLTSPGNDKSVQTNFTKRRLTNNHEYKRRKMVSIRTFGITSSGEDSDGPQYDQYQIPVILNVQAEPVKPALVPKSKMKAKNVPETIKIQNVPNNVETAMESMFNAAPPTPVTPNMPPPTTIPEKATTEPLNTKPISIGSHRFSIGSQDSNEDQVMKDLEELFKTDGTDNEEDLFADTINDKQIQLIMSEIEQFKMTQESTKINEKAALNDCNGTVPSLDERLAVMESNGILKVEKLAERVEVKSKKTTKWTCELHFQRLLLCQKLESLCEYKRKKHIKIKSRFIELFGPDSEDEQWPQSPEDETLELVASCRERAGPWVVQGLMPHYARGRIASKQLFKNLAKRLTTLIVECNRYPDEHEVQEYVENFFKTHPRIRCEADML